MRISILLAMLAFSVPALCHIPFYEPQLLNLDDQDWSLETPFEVPRDEAEGWSPSLNTARAYISVVGGEEDPYDVVTFTIGEDEEPQHLGAVVPYITACEATENAFLTVALLGPESERFPAASDEVASTLPFTIPEGYGIIVREEPQETRPMLYEYYFAPLPLTEDCLNEPENLNSEECGGGETLIVNYPGQDEPLAPGKYYLAWWLSGDFAGPIDISLTAGLEESTSTKEAELAEAEVEYAFESCPEPASMPASE